MLKCTESLKNNKEKNSKNLYIIYLKVHIILLNIFIFIIKFSRSQKNKCRYSIFRNVIARRYILTLKSLEKDEISSDYFES